MARREKAGRVDIRSVSGDNAHLTLQARYSADSERVIYPARDVEITVRIAQVRTSRAEIDAPRRYYRYSVQRERAAL